MPINCSIDYLLFITFCMPCSLYFPNSHLKHKIEGPRHDQLQGIQHHQHQHHPKNLSAGFIFRLHNDNPFINYMLIVLLSRQTDTHKTK